MTTTTDSTQLEALVDAHLDAYGDPDQTRRRATIERVWATDGKLVDPPLQGEGHDGISAAADAVQQHYAEHRFARTSQVDAHNGVARYAWTLSAPDGTPVLTGTDVVRLTEDGRIQEITGFFGELAPAA